MSGSYTLDGLNPAAALPANSPASLTVRKHWPTLRALASFGLISSEWSDLLTPDVNDEIARQGLTVVGPWVLSGETATADLVRNGRQPGAVVSAMANALDNALHPLGLALTRLGTRQRVAGEEARTEQRGQDATKGAAVEAARTTWLDSLGLSLGVGTAVVVIGAVVVLFLLYAPKPARD